ncbi:MAG: hypothetical protein M5T61_05430 [Acidimicrobiia bacterium]|nr:hypothetical protein [Acidimicrobiia bacterium]
MEIDAVEDHLAVVDVVEAGEAVEQRRLPRAGRAHHREELTHTHCEIDRPQGLDLLGPGPVDLPDTARHQNLVAQLLPSLGPGQANRL